MASSFGNDFGSSDTESRSGSFADRSRSGHKNHRKKHEESCSREYDKNFSEEERRILDGYDCKIKRFIVENVSALQCEIRRLEQQVICNKEEAICAFTEVRQELCIYREALRRIGIATGASETQNARLYLRVNQLQKMLLAAGLVDAAEDWADAANIDGPDSTAVVPAGGKLAKVAKAAVAADITAGLALGGVLPNVGGPFGGFGACGVGGFGVGACGCGVASCGGACGFGRGACGVGGFGVGGFGACGCGVANCGGACGRRRRW